MNTNIAVLPLWLSARYRSYALEIWRYDIHKQDLEADYCDGLVQDCSNSIANALELLQYCTKPSIGGVYSMESRNLDLTAKYQHRINNINQIRNSYRI